MTAVRFLPTDRKSDIFTFKKNNIMIFADDRSSLKSSSDTIDGKQRLPQEDASWIGRRVQRRAEKRWPWLESQV